MNNFTIVRPEHLNHYGYLFGGVLLKWIDENAWLVASRNFRDCTLVTIGMNDISFNEPVKSGSILRFNILMVKQGRTSATYSVKVFADEPGAKTEKLVFTTLITFVRIDQQGQKIPLPEESTAFSAKD